MENFRMKQVRTTGDSLVVDRRRVFLGLPVLAAGASWPHAARAAEPAPIVTHHRTKEVDGIKIFYREAGPETAPVVLLLHGFPTSSHMFRNLIPALADRYHVIAPDYPGYGQSDKVRLYLRSLRRAR
jgi:poly(3-hydroxybutyrate) depolymerase